MLLGLVLLTGTANAAKTEAESTWDRWTTMNDLELEEDLLRPVEQPIEIRQGPGKLRLEGGYLVPVFSGRFGGAWEADARKILREQREQGLDPRLPTAEERGTRELVGWVWTGGTGTLTVRLPDRADALVLANRMVTELGAEADAVAALAHGEAPLVTRVSDVVVVSVDPQLDEIFRGPDDVDPYEIVVFGEGKEARRARARASQVFDERSTVWASTALEPGDRIGWDRIAVERDAAPATGTLALIDALTDTRYGLVAPQVGGDADKWLAVIRDSTGLVDRRRAFRVASLGVAPSGQVVDGLVGGLPHPPVDPSDSTSAPTPMARVEAVHADSRVLVHQSRSGLDLEVEIDSTLRFRAVGGPAAWIDLAVPKMDRVPGTFQVVTAELEDGTPLLGRPPVEPETALGEEEPPEPPEPEPGPGEPEPEPEELPEPEDAVIRLLLPQPLAPGDQVVVHLKHVDTWPYANFSDSYTGTISAGRSSGMQGFLPSVLPGDPGSPWRFSALVAVPEGSKLVAAIGGVTTNEEDRDGWHVVEASTGELAARWPAVAVGRFKVVDEPSKLGFPAVRTRLLSTQYGSIEDFAPEVRRVVEYYQRWLPPFPVGEVEIFEAPRQHGGFVWIAPHGMVNVQQMLVMGTVRATAGLDVPRLASGVFAHELAHQYWGHLAPPATDEDFWIAETMSEVFSCMYVGAAFDPEDCEERMAQARELWEAKQRPEQAASLSRAYSSRAQPDIVYRYGPLLFADGLRRDLGTEAFFAAFDVLLRDHPREPLTTERFQAYLERASGRELGDWFAFWVHGGYGPELEASWSRVGRTVSGSLSADIPFGTFEVPLRVVTKEGAVDVTVQIVDGHGEFEVEAPSAKKLEVQVDPDHRLVARRRAAREAAGRKR